jgi:signal transduction histidine kinase
VRTQAAAQHAAALNQLLAEPAIALGVMAVVSVALGWLVAGRVPRPLRAMTAAARAISADDLSRRVAVAGPDDELKDLGDTIDGLLHRLETAFSAQRRFAASASHQLRTPLAMMRTSVDVATAKPGPVPADLTVLAGKLREGLDQADSPLPPTRLDPLVDRHPPNSASRVQETGAGLGGAGRQHDPQRHRPPEADPGLVRSAAVGTVTIISSADDQDRTMRVLNDLMSHASNKEGLEV